MTHKLGLERVQKCYDEYNNYFYPNDSHMRIRTSSHASSYHSTNLITG